MSAVKNFFVEIWYGLRTRFKQSFTWLSMQLLAIWGTVWVIYSMLPATVMAELANVSWMGLSVVGWMGVVQTITIYLGRVKTPKELG